MQKAEFSNGTKLLLVDDLAPEDLAMLQALYSRSAESAEVHLEKVKKAGSGKFMASYYVGYNHKSIADCGTTTMFIEGVSTLVAKAIQDWPLYSGQETSTRYIDMSKQHIIDPVDSYLSSRIIKRWMNFYISSQDRVAQTVRERHPKGPEESDRDYDGAVKARTFDILRGFLPAGITTQLSWHTNLRQAGDHLNLLARHPAEDVRIVAKYLQRMFAEQYPSSNSSGAFVSAVTGGDEAREKWEQQCAYAHTYPSYEIPGQRSYARAGLNGDVIFRSILDRIELDRYREQLAERPRGSMLPHFMTDFGQTSFSFLLDFGSFRDIQRHRNGVCRMPLLSTENGFEPWYLEQLDPELRDIAGRLIEEQMHEINGLTNAVDVQNYIALGFRVPCKVTYALPALLYVLELRSSKTVHPTLRRIVHSMVEKFRETYPNIALHADMDPDAWTVRRGRQTIQAKE